MVKTGTGRAGDHSVASAFDTVFTWRYDKGADQGLERLYEKAKVSSWSAADLPWSTAVDPEEVAVVQQGSRRASGFAPRVVDGVLASWTEADWLRLDVEYQRWLLSQFLHGEQGALLCTARIVETVPGMDAKLYAASQVMDEARHVEVFSRYLQEKLGGEYPVNAHLGDLLDLIISDARWDVTYLGMQIMVEGLALASFGILRTTTSEPLLREMLRRVMADEARHVAFGVLALTEAYRQMSAAELGERAEFAYEAAIRMHERLQAQEVWERLGVPPARATEILSMSPKRRLFQQMLFSKIVPNCAKLGLLDANGGWLRRRFTEMDVIGFEHASGAAGTDQVPLSA